MLEHDLAHPHPLLERHRVVEGRRHLQGEVVDGGGAVELGDVEVEPATQK